MIVKMHIFLNFLPDHEDFVLGMSYVSIYLLLSNHDLIVRI